MLLNSDVVAHAGWLEVLQHTAYTADAGITGGQLLYPDGTIQFGGMIRNPYHPEWFEHRYRGRQGDLPEASVQQPTLAVTGACMYVTRTTLDDIGTLDEGYEMAFEDVDYCLRAWQAGHRVVYAPAAQLTHAESKTRGLTQGPRELRSQARFWDRWGDHFDRRDVSGASGGAADHLRDQGHRRRRRPPGRSSRTSTGSPTAGTTWSCGRWARPSRTGSTCAFRSAASRTATRSIAALTPVDAIKVATWWETSDWVFEASLLRGVPVYWVQDIETSYYSWHADRAKVLASYRPEYTLLRRLGVDPRRSCVMIVPNDVTTFTPGHRPRALPRPGRASSGATTSILALGRSEPLKDFPLTRDTYEALDEPKPSCGCSASSPTWPTGLGAPLHRAPVATRRSTRSTTRPRSCSRRASTKASACPCWRRWRPAPSRSPPTPTATATSASTARTA